MVTRKKAYKDFTRAQAEKALQRGVSPEEFTSHANYHVRVKAWKKMGKPLPSDPVQANEFLLSLQGKDYKNMSAEEKISLVALQRKRLLGEVVAEGPATGE